MQYDVSPVKLSLSLEQEEQIVLASLRKFKDNLITEMWQGGTNMAEVYENSGLIRACMEIIHFYGG